MTHRTTDSRIAIVGAGPAGLSLAWYLSQLGFTSVELFDSAAEPGGQSHTVDVDGTPIEMGTCYLSDGYIIAREIADAAGTPAKRLPPPSFVDAHGKVYPPSMPSTWLIVRYLLHWFWWYLGGQMGRPTRPANALPFDAWLRQVGLGELATSSVFADACTAQLYGPVPDVTAHNGLSWVRPSLLLTGIREDTAHIPAGFQNMWRRLASKLGYRMRLGCAVSEVRPAADGQGVNVILADSSATERFDHVFVACPLDGTAVNNGVGVRTPLSALLRDGYAPFDDTPVYSAIWRASAWPSEVPSRCYLPACADGERGRLLTIRQYATTGSDWIGQLCAYAVLPKSGDPEQSTLGDTRDRIVRDMKEIVGLRDVQILQDRVWRYSIRYSGEQLKQQLPGAISKFQGIGNVWYSGGGLSHWDVDMISNFSQSLAWRFAGSVGMSLFARLRIVQLKDLIRDL